MPFPLAAIPIALQAGVGLHQLIKGQSEADALKRPVYKRPEEVTTQRRMAEQYAQEGLTGAAKNLYQQRAERAAATGLRNMATRQQGIQGLGDLTQGLADTGMQMALADEERRRANQQNLSSLLGQQAAYSDKEFSYNQAEPYQLGAQAAQAKIGAGLQNIYGSLGAGVGALQQGQYLNTLTGIADKDRSALMDYLNKVGTTNATDLSGSGMYGGGAGGGGGTATSALMGLGGLASAIAPSAISNKVAASTPTVTPQSPQVDVTQVGAGLSQFAQPATGGLNQADIDLWKTVNYGDVKNNPELQKLAQKVRNSPYLNTVWDSDPYPYTEVSDDFLLSKLKLQNYQSNFLGK